MPTGGNAAIQGIKAQSLVCLLNALEPLNQWTSFTLEPDFVNSKVDILWNYGDQTKCVQVKSSRAERFTKKGAEKIAKEVEAQNEDCSSFALFLVGKSFGELVHEEQLTEKTIVKLVPFVENKIWHEACAFRLYNYLIVKKSAKSASDVNGNYRKSVS